MSTTMPLSFGHLSGYSNGRAYGDLRKRSKRRARPSISAIAGQLSIVSSSPPSNSSGMDHLDPDEAFLRGFSLSSDTASLLQGQYGREKQPYFVTGSSIPSTSRLKNDSDSAKPWFWPSATRDASELALLRAAEAACRCGNDSSQGCSANGLFLVRPSKRTGKYAISYVDSFHSTSSETRFMHTLVYESTNGTLSVKRHAPSAERFASMEDIIAALSFLTEPVVDKSVVDETEMSAALDRLSSGLLTELQALMRSQGDGVEPIDVWWEFAQTKHARSPDGDHRTYVRLGKREFTLPKLEYVQETVLKDFCEAISSSVDSIANMKPIYPDNIGPIDSDDPDFELDWAAMHDRLPPLRLALRGFQDLAGKPHSPLSSSAFESLCSTFVTGRAVRLSIGPTISMIPRIVVLDVSNNALTDDQAEILSAVLHDPGVALVNVSVSGNHFSVLGCMQLVDAVSGSNPMSRVRRISLFPQHLPSNVVPGSVKLSFKPRHSLAVSVLQRSPQPISKVSDVRRAQQIVDTVLQRKMEMGVSSPRTLELEASRPMVVLQFLGWCTPTLAVDSALAGAIHSCVMFTCAEAPFSLVTCVKAGRDQVFFVIFHRHEDGFVVSTRCLSGSCHRALPSLKMISAWSAVSSENVGFFQGMPEDAVELLLKCEKHVYLWGAPSTHVDHGTNPCFGQVFAAKDLVPETVARFVVEPPTSLLAHLESTCFATVGALSAVFSSFPN